MLKSDVNQLTPDRPRVAQLTLSDADSETYRNK